MKSTTPGTGNLELNPMDVRKIRTRIRIIMPLFGLSFMGWMLFNMQARLKSDDVLESTAQVRVMEDDERIAFTPEPDSTTPGLLFYPGALVDPQAYTPMARRIAEAGYEAQIIKVPYRMAAMDWQKNAVEEYTLSTLARSSEKQWVLAGHSRGARMALAFTLIHQDKLAGLVLVGSSHPRKIDHSHLQLPVMKVYGSRDGLASEAEVEQFKHNLPDQTNFVRIEGGNHAQFGWYGTQFGDDEATISREAQQTQLVEAILDFLKDTAP